MQDRGGLSIRKARNQNLALLTKLSWKVTMHEDSLWVKMLRDEYIRNQSLSSWPKKRNASHVWRSMVNTNHIIERRIKWTIRDGSKVDLWKDWWCGSGPLILKYQGPHTNSNTKVKEIVDDNDTWDLSNIAHIVDEQDTNIIHNIHLSSNRNSPDHPTYVGQSWE